jgi:ferric-dicitrate binding protein FerR (iron transport regulator)
MSEEYKELDSLLQGLVEESLSETEREELEQKLKNDPKACQRYVDYMAVEAQLSSHKTKVEHAEEIQQKPDEKVISIPRELFDIRKLYMVAAALLLIGAISIVILNGLRPPPDRRLRVQSVKERMEKFNIVGPIASLKNIIGDGSIRVNSETVVLKKGMQVVNGAELICPMGENELQVTMKDGSFIKIASGSRVIFSHVDGQYKLILNKGFIVADVNKQPEGRPMLISTPNAELVVLGTVFRVIQEKKSTRLIVDEGEVQIANEERNVAFVEGGESALAQKKLALQKKSLKGYDVENLEIIRAIYGAEDSWIEVTRALKTRATNSRLIPTGLFNNLEYDPLYREKKSIKIKYEINGQVGEVEISEHVKGYVFRTELILPEL